MKFSFIIATVNRNEQLQSCIDSIGRAYQYGGGLEIEILIVFQNAENKNGDIKIKYPELTTIYHIKTKGLSRARNYAIKRSKGDFLIFLDDDAQIKEDFLKVLSEVSSISSGEAFCGRILEQNTDRAFSICFMDDKKRYLSRADFTYFRGSAHIFKKSVFSKVGFYDERFGAGAEYPAAEETDMFFRLKRQGIKVIYLPELVFFHPVSYQTSTHKVFNYFYAIGAMLAKQTINDRIHFFVYFKIILELLLKSFFRILQHLLFPKTIAQKNERFQFKSVFKGIIYGVINYLKFNIKENATLSMKRIKGIITKATFLLAHNPRLFFKMLNAKIRPLPKSPVQKKVNGVLFEFDFDYDPVIKAMYYGSYDMYTVEVMRKLLKKDDTFIDVGANIGYLSAMAMGFVGKIGQVHSFEPVPQYFSRLKNIATANKEHKLVVNQCALSDRHETARMSVTSLSNIGWNTMVPALMSAEATDQTIEVTANRLDSYIKEKGLNNISLIKIDTEGFEFPVLKGLSGYFEETGCRPRIICEIGPTAYPLLGHTLVDLSTYMNKYNYRAFSLVNPNREIEITELKETTNVVFRAGNGQ